MTPEEALFPTSDTLQYEVLWELDMMQGDDQYVVAWYQVTSKTSQYSDYFLGCFIYTPEGYQELRDDRGRPMLAAAKALQRARLAEAKPLEYPKHLNGEFYANLDEAIVDLYARGRNGEFIGQSNSLIYLQDVLAIYDADMRRGYEVMNKLFIQQKLALNGNIIIPWEDYEASREYMQKKTGHKDYHTGDTDMSGWWCTACNKHGYWDSEPPFNDPTKVPCV